MTKLSIIIPVYNSEKFIEKCLSSILNQTYTNMEIICIDDNSSDTSYEIIKSFASKDKRIKIYKNEKNFGVSYSRSIGIKHSTGYYIHFVDSDDFLEENFYKSLFLASENYTKDLIFCRCCKIDSLQAKSEYIFSEKNKKLDDWSTSTVWFYIFKREIIVKNNITFPLNISYAEDNFFSFLLFKKIQNFAYSDEAVYYYRQHESSITDNVTDNSAKYFKFCNDRLGLWDLLLNDFLSRTKEEQFRFLESYLNFFLMLYTDFNLSKISLQIFFQLFRRQHLFCRFIHNSKLSKKQKSRYKILYSKSCIFKYLRKNIISFKLGSSKSYLRILGHEIYRREFCAE